MINKLKSYLYKKRPEISAASYSYSTVRNARKTVLKTTPYCFKFKGPDSMQQAVFEPELTKIIIQYLRETNVFIDIGANTGYFSCIGKLLNNYVVAVEPLTQNLEFLYVNLIANGWNDIEIIPVGLASKPGLAKLYGTGTAASLIRDWDGLSTKERTVPLSTLDIILGDRFVNQKLLIKIDVEGSEYDVLKGAVNTLASMPSPVWVVEICLTEHHPNGLNPHFYDTFDAFWSYGYNAYMVGENNKLLLPSDIESSIRYRDINLGNNFLFRR
jgi:FkbM family methyltransferase